MGQLYVRIDDRLIHGQIVMSWCGALGVGELIAVDDILASNPVMQSVMLMGVPTTYKPRIVTTEQARDLLRQEQTKTRLVITRFARNLGSLRDEIKNAEHVNIGNSSKQPGEVARVTGIGVGAVLSFTQDDINTLDALESDGVPVICQMVPTDKLRTWAELKKQF